MFGDLPRASAGLLVILCVALPAAGEQPYPVDWIRQMGTSGYDSFGSVAVDAYGNAWFSGSTLGDLGGESAGSYDVVLGKFSPAGDLLWLDQFGTGNPDYNGNVALDRFGNVLLGGLANQLPVGAELYATAFLRKYEDNGDMQWERQFGWPELPFKYNGVVGVGADGAGNVFAAGTSSPFPPGEGEGFLRKYDPDGQLIWPRGLPGGITCDLTVDEGGNSVICGWGSVVHPSAGGLDAFVARYNGAGDLLWARQIGTPVQDQASGVATDGAGNVLVAGYTRGALDGENQGDLDYFLAKYDADGELLWLSQVGTAGNDIGSDVVVDAAGNAYVTGRTDGYPVGSVTTSNAFVSKFDPDGELLWTQRIGTPDSLEYAHGIALDGEENLIIVGSTDGDLAGVNAGKEDAFIAKLTVPEPGAIALLAAASWALLRRRRNAPAKRGR